MEGVILNENGGETTWDLDKKRTDFANQLLSICAVPTDCDMLVYPLTISLDSTEESSASLIVRARVKALWEKVLENIENTTTTITTSIVTGNPGIGKTRSMDYLLKLLLHKNKLVFYDQRESGIVLVFVPPTIHRLDETYKVYCTKNFDAEETQLNVQSGSSPPYYLFNPANDPARNVMPRGNLNYHLVIAVSPNPYHVKGWWKSHGCLGKYVMPSWTLSELSACAPLFKLTHKQMVSGFCRYGGIIRPIVGTQFMKDSYESDLLEGVDALPANTMECMLRGDMIGINSQSIHVPSGLFRIEPTTDDFQTFFVSFASPFTCALVAAKFWTRMAQMGHGSDRRYTKWFEFLCILVLSKGGSFQARRLMSTSEKKTLSASASSFITRSLSEELESSASDLFFMSNENSLTETSAGSFTEPTKASNANKDFYNLWASNQLPAGSHNNYILVPRTKTLPVVDCVSLPHPKSGIPRGFQVIVSGSHPVSYGETETILSLLFPNDSQKDEHFDLYFVVPEHLVDDFKRQNLKGGKNKRSLHHRVNQYVIGISVDNIQDFARLYQKCVDDNLANFMEHMLYHSS
jgi:hypothetical protein